MRANNWQTLLIEYIEEHKHTEFVWGKTDCCHFASKWVLQLIGIDVSNNFSCNNARDALKIVSDNEGISKIVDNYFYRITVKQAKRGDVIEAIVDGKRSAIGICNGINSFLKAKGTGLVEIPTLECMNAWEIS